MDVPHRPRSGAERVLALEGGTNFRDIGGYSIGNSRVTRWGHVFRSGALGRLTQNDLTTLAGVGIRSVIDLRCAEERALAPGLLPHLCEPALDYPQERVFARPAGTEAEDLYRMFPELLVPHFRQFFATLDAGRSPVIVHCSAGQDRTGVMIGVFLAALGVGMEQIIDDYMMTPALRRRENELDPVRVQELAGSNPVAAFYHRIQTAQQDHPVAPKPLLDRIGRPQILLAFEEIERRWGSVPDFLDAVCGVDPDLLERVREISTVPTP